MNRDRLLAHLKKEEYCNLKRHLVHDVPHIGWGRSLGTKGLSDEELTEFGIEDEDELHEITQAQADQLLENDIKDAIEDARRVCKDFKRFSEVRQEVLVSMAFNLGGAGLQEFRKMLRSLYASDYEKAAKHMLDSKAARIDAPARYKRLANAMRTDSPSAFELPAPSLETPVPPALDIADVPTAQLAETIVNCLEELKRRVDGNQK